MGAGHPGRSGTPRSQGTGLPRPAFAAAGAHHTPLPEDLRAGVRRIQEVRRTRKREPAVSRVLSGTIIHLGQSSPTASSNLPGSPLGTGGADCPHTPLFGLAPGGVYRAAVCCHPRGALLPHLFTLAGVQSTLGRSVFCGTFHGLTSSRRYLAPCPMEPGLSSGAALIDDQQRRRLSGRLSPSRRRMIAHFIEVEPGFSGLPSAVVPFQVRRENLGSTPIKRCYFFDSDKASILRYRAFLF